MWQAPRRPTLPTPIPAPPTPGKLVPYDRLAKEIGLLLSASQLSGRPAVSLPGKVASTPLLAGLAHGELDFLRCPRRVGYSQLPRAGGGGARFSYERVSVMHAHINGPSAFPSHLGP